LPALAQNDFAATSLLGWVTWRSSREPPICQVVAI
jgi:hypothetical protein